jgi:hypothetical protein
MAIQHVTGLEEVIRELNRRSQAIQNATEQSLQEVALDVIGKARELAPLDTGDLRSSGYAKVEGLNVELGFTAPYALIQHERLDFKHPRGGQAKYLEQPLKQNIDNYIQHIANNASQATQNPGFFRRVVNKIKNFFGAGNSSGSSNNTPNITTNLNNFGR